MIKPMKLFEDGMYFINHKDQFNSFLWDTEKEKGNFVGEIEKIKKYSTLHTYGYYGFFKPSLNEVYDQIEHIEDAIGFTIEIDYSKHRYGLSEDQKHHLAKVTLWRKK